MSASTVSWSPTARAPAASGAAGTAAAGGRSADGAAARNYSMVAAQPANPANASRLNQRTSR